MNSVAIDLSIFSFSNTVITTGMYFGEVATDSASMGVTISGACVSVYLEVKGFVVM